MIRLKGKRISIEINNRVKFYKCKSRQQKCVYCGVRMALHKDTLGVLMSNADDGLTLHKTLWMHINCSMKFSAMVKKSYKKHEDFIVAEEV